MIRDLQDSLLNALRSVLLLGSIFLSGCTPGTPIGLFDDFEGDAVASFWRSGSAGSGRYAPGAVVISEDYARSGRSSVRITVEQGDIEQDGGDGKRTERAELDSGKFALLGEDVWYGVSFLIPERFPIVDNRLVITQWKQDTAENSLIALRFRNGRLYVTISAPETLTSDKTTRYPLPAITLGAWHDMVYHVVYSSNSDGLVEIWMDGRQVVTHRGATAVQGGPNLFYNKLGLYRDRWEEPMTIYFDNYKVGGEFADVDPARLDP